MTQYRVLQKSFIGGSLCEVGAVVEYDGEAGANLEPLNPVVAEVKPARAKRVVEVAPADPVPSAADGS